MAANIVKSLFLLLKNSLVIIPNVIFKFLPITGLVTYIFNTICGIVNTYVDFVNNIMYVIPKSILSGILAFTIDILGYYFPICKYFTLKSVRFGLVIGFFFWSSVISYAVLYFFTGGYLPFLANYVEYNIPIHFNQQCEVSSGLCSSPKYDLTSKCTVDSCDKPVLPYFEQGKIYKFDLMMETLPLTQTNCKEINTDHIMVASKLYTSSKVAVESATKVYYPQAILQNPNILYRMLQWILYIPLYIPKTILRLGNDKQTMNVQLISQYSMLENEQIAGLYMEVQSNCVQITSALLIISQTFSGLRYYLFYHPVASTLLGIPIMMCFISCIFLFMWKQIIPRKRTESVEVSEHEHEN